MHTNDLHGQIQPIPWRTEDGTILVGGAPALGALIRQERARAEAMGEGFLYLDAGDLWQGTPDGNLTGGRVVVEWMNLIGVDAVAVGNHEYDEGEVALRALAVHARFPILGANVHQADGGAFPYLQPWVIREVAGVRIGIGGILTSRTGMLTRKGVTEGVAFGDEVQVARRVVQELRAAGAEVVILITHVGVDVDAVLARLVEGVDLIVGGHSHTAIASPAPESQTGTLVVQTQGKGRALGVVQLTWDRRVGRVTETSGRLVPVLEAEAGRDPETVALVKRWTAEIGRRMAEPIGTTTAPLVREPAMPGSSPLGNLVADIMREATDARFAFHNRTGIRADLPGGTITLRDVYQVCPFGNSLVTMELTGAQVKKVLAYSVLEHRYGLEISGLEVEVRDRKGIPRIGKVRVMPGGGRLDPRKVYRAVTNSYLGKGGDGEGLFAGATAYEDTGIVLRDVMTEYLRRNSPIEVPGVSRYIVHEGKAQPRAGVQR